MHELFGSVKVRVLLSLARSSDHVHPQQRDSFSFLLIPRADSALSTSILFSNAHFPVHAFTRSCGGGGEPLSHSYSLAVLLEAYRRIPSLCTYDVVAALCCTAMHWVAHLPDRLPSSLLFPAKEENEEREEREEEAATDLDHSHSSLSEDSMEQGLAELSLFDPSHAIRMQLTADFGGFPFDSAAEKAFLKEEEEPFSALVEKEERKGLEGVLCGAIPLEAVLGRSAIMRDIDGHLPETLRAYSPMNALTLCRAATNSDTDTLLSGGNKFMPHLSLEGFGAQAIPARDEFRYSGTVCSL